MHNLNRLTDLELRIYDEQIKIPSIGTEGQIRLKQFNALVIGIGGTGLTILQHLTALGIGTIAVCDFEKVRESHLNRQILFNVGDLGKLKTVVTKEKLNLINPAINIHLHNIKVNAENVEFICNNYSLIFDCTNDEETNTLIYNYTSSKNIVLVITRYNLFWGEILVKTKPISSTTLPFKITRHQNIGKLVVVIGLLGSIAASEALKVLFNLNPVSENFRVQFDIINNTLTKFIDA